MRLRNPPGFALTHFKSIACSSRSLLIRRRHTTELACFETKIRSAQKWKLILRVATFNFYSVVPQRVHAGTELRSAPTGRRHDCLQIFGSPPHFCLKILSLRRGIVGSDQFAILSPVCYSSCRLYIFTTAFKGNHKFCSVTRAIRDKAHFRKFLCH